MDEIETSVLRHHLFSCFSSILEGSDGSRDDGSTSTGEFRRHKSYAGDVLGTVFS